MASNPKKNAILGGVAAGVLVIAVLLLFRDFLFGGSADTGPAMDEQTAAGVKETFGGDLSAEPPPENPKPTGSGKLGGSR